MPDNQEFERLLKVVAELTIQLKSVTAEMNKIKAAPASQGKSGLEALKKQAQELNAQLEKARIAYNSFGAAPTKGGSKPPVSTTVPGGAPGGFDTKAAEGIMRNVVKTNKASEKISAAKQKQLEAEEKIHKELVKTLNLERNKNVRLGAIAAGHTNPEKDLKEIYSRGTGIERFKFEGRDEEGVKRQTDL